MPCAYSHDLWFQDWLCLIFMFGFFHRVVTVFNVYYRPITLTGHESVVTQIQFPCQSHNTCLALSGSAVN